MGETRVDLQHLLEDIRDAYPGSLEETIVTEIVANSLDSGAGSIRFEADPAVATLTVVDDGSGMARGELRRYHDIAASTKSRGEGIGFAGVGIKLGILASEEVVTETRRGKSHVASSWRLSSRNKAPWRWIPPPGLVGVRGTAVRLRLRNPLSPLLESGFLEATLRQHFEPLFDPAFEELLSRYYPSGVRFSVNGHALSLVDPNPARALVSVRLGRKRKPSAAGFLHRHREPLAEDQQGVAVSTLGKVIKRGWDWLGFSPAEAARLSGLIEVPGLAECLTLNKADFIRTGPHGALYLACRKGIQEAVSAQLAAWGESPDALGDEARRRKARPVERDLASVLAEMADDFPLIASLVEQRAGGQKRLLVSSRTAGRGSTSGQAELRLEAAAASATHGSLDTAGEQSAAAGGALESETAEAGTAGDGGRGEGGKGGGASHGEPPSLTEAQSKPEPSPTPGSEGRSSTDSGTDTGPSPGELPGEVDWPRAGRLRRRPSRLGLTLQFESRPDDPQLGRLVDTTVWVNEAHPAYRRAAASRAEGYHLALTVAMALAPLAVEAAETHAFVTAFLARWGEAVERPQATASVRRRRSRIRR
jgi:Histidine kinase-, DNA gyrase B-, and HSP90-like ATPase